MCTPIPGPPVMADMRSASVGRADRTTELVFRSIAVRGDLTDAEWERLRSFLPVSNRRCGRWREHRQVIDGILYRVRTGTPRRSRRSSRGTPCRPRSPCVPCALGPSGADQAMPDASCGYPDSPDRFS
ncbi:transposase [Streptomyces sp. NPDC030920]|uniref:transposase n=1 Tax=Streptomyces sp. NPDC030920 TaxID=3365308 RepID=UPI00384F4383